MTTAFLSLALLVLGADPTPGPELLPAAPPDWRFERIDFPLEFAPQLRYDGFEELLFAPGMFNAKSDTYFTYVFALKITNDITIDKAWLESFLETYYRGLCKTVAEGTDFVIDASKISATVREDHYEAQHARHFSATLASFDPFVTGKPLTLNLEILLLETSRTDHRIFAAVSPKPADSPVWKLLRKLRRQFHSPAADTGKKTN